MNEGTTFTVTWFNGEENREVKITVEWDTQSEDYYLKFEDEYHIAGDFIPTAKETAYSIGLRFMKWAGFIG